MRLLHHEELAADRVQRELEFSRPSGPGEGLSWTELQDVIWTALQDNCDVRMP